MALHKLLWTTEENTREQTFTKDKRNIEQSDHMTKTVTGGKHKVNKTVQT